LFNRKERKERKEKPSHVKARSGIRCQESGIRNARAGLKPAPTKHRVRSTRWDSRHASLAAKGRSSPAYDSSLRADDHFFVIFVFFVVKRFFPPRPRELMFF
jgi:hypothetical protein